MQIHERIKTERIKAGLTEAQIADKLGVKRSTYQYWEKETPAIDKIKAVARALGLNDEYFFRIDDQKIVNGAETEPTPMQILSVLAQAFKDQAAALTIQSDILRSIESKVARESSLVSLREDVRAISARQKGTGDVLLRSLERLEKKKKGDLVREADKQIFQIDKEVHEHDNEVAASRQDMEVS